MTIPSSNNLSQLQNLEGRLQTAIGSYEQLKEEYAKESSDIFNQFGVSSLEELIEKSNLLQVECERMLVDVKESIDAIGI
jgi:hypothetical protein